MKPFLTLLLLTLTLSAFAQYEPKNQQEKNAIQLIALLPEVSRFNKYMLKKHGSPLIVQMDSDPIPTDQFYTIAVIEDLRETNHFFTYWRFCVNKKTKAISYLDVIAGKRIPLNTWRKNGRKW